VLVVLDVLDVVVALEPEAAVELSVEKEYRALA